MKKIFMVCYGGIHVRMLAKIYNYLIKDKRIEIKIFALTEAQKYLSTLGIPYTTMKEYNQIFKDSATEEIGRKFIKKLDLNFKDKESILYYGYNFKELIEHYGEEKSIEGYKKFGRWCFLPIKFMEKVIQYENPNLVITTNSPRMEKAAIIVAKKLQINNIYIEHLFFETPEIYNEMYDFFSNKQYVEYFDKNIFVPFEYSRDNICREIKGIEKDLIKVVGNPVYDDIFSTKIVKIPFLENRKGILFLSQPLKEQKKYISKILEIIESERNNNLFLILKLHPNENKEDYIELVNNSKMKKNIFIIKNEYSLHSCIKSSEYIISRNSSTVIDSNLLGKPVIAERNDAFSVKELGIGLEYKNLDEIEKCIKNISSFKYKKLNVIENSSEVIKNEILKILNF